jgi:hypothetical protein
VKGTALGNNLNISEKNWKLFIVLSVAWLIAFFLMLIPPMRSIAIRFGELLVRRPLIHTIWHTRLIKWGATGLIEYLVLLLLLYHQTVLSNKSIIKNTYRLLVPGAIVFVVFIILFHANWIFSDDHILITTTAINKYASRDIGMGSGRFIPFAFLYYNIPLAILRLLGINDGLPVTAHFIVIALFYMTTTISLYFLFKNLKPAGTENYLFISVFFCLIFPLTSTAFVRVYMELIYSETAVLMFLAVFMLMFYKARTKNDSPRPEVPPRTGGRVPGMGSRANQNKYYIIALSAAVLASYYKEPIFGALIIIALTNLIFRPRDQAKKERWFYILLIVNGIIYMLLYYFLSFRKSGSHYNSARIVDSGIELISEIFLDTYILIPLFLLGLIRIFYVIAKRDNKHLFYDSLLFGGMGFVCAYIFLHLKQEYYFLPAIVLALPSFVFWTKYLYKKKSIKSLFLLFSIIVICGSNVDNEVDSVKKSLAARKEFMPYVNNLLSKYNEGKIFIWYESDNAPTANTFYKSVRKWRKDTLNAFLNYANKTTTNDFLNTAGDINENVLILNKDVLFLYPVDNDQWQPIPDSLVNTLNNAGFRLSSDTNGIRLYEHID